MYNPSLPPNAVPSQNDFLTVYKGVSDPGQVETHFTQVHDQFHVTTNIPIKGVDLPGDQISIHDYVKDMVFDR